MHVLHSVGRFLTFHSVAVKCRCPCFLLQILQNFSMNEFVFWFWSGSVVWNTSLTFSNCTSFSFCSKLLFFAGKTIFSMLKFAMLSVRGSVFCRLKLTQRRLCLMSFPSFLCFGFEACNKFPAAIVFFAIPDIEELCGMRKATPTSNTECNTSNEDESSI